MASLNTAQIIGNIGIAPELAKTNSGQSVANMSVAVNENFVNNQGDKVEHTEWFRIVLWGNLAETCAKFGCDKGNMVYVEGRLRTREWEDKEGVKRFTTELIASRVQFLSPKKNGTMPDTSDEGSTTDESEQRPDIEGETPEDSPPYA